MASDEQKEPAPVPEKDTGTPPKTTPVDQKAQEEAGKVREESGGYD